LITKVLHIDERWIYTEQIIVRNNTVIAICIVKNTVKKGNETIHTNLMAKELGFTMLPTEGKEITRALKKIDHLVYQRLAAAKNDLR